ncbi:cupin domain-containing protein [Pseudoxanthobacter sp.]|uniref:cupin domain-containing protein n=1 Tax=Pseudoxanthobacter sp. TaxID=1925742 RepID=UPI002FE33108
MSDARFARDGVSAEGTERHGARPLPPRAAEADRVPDDEVPAAAGTAEDPVAALGPMIREARKRKAMTLAEVSGRTGLSVGHLSQVERGLSTPTIRQLQQIAEVMGVTIGWFFRSDTSDRAEEDGDVVVRADKRRRMSIDDNSLIDELLVPDLHGALELLFCTIQPGAGSGPEPYSHEGEEAGLILTGEMELWVDNKRYHLRAGDSFSFESTRPHHYRNSGTGPLQVVWAITPPTY